jgi:hypothetical protein
MAKKLIIDEAHKEAIEEALAQAQGNRVRERRIDSLRDVEWHMAQAMKGFPDIPKKHWEGCILTIQEGAGKFPNAYKGIPMGTEVTIKFRADGKGEITRISRENCNNAKTYIWHITETMHRDILDSMNIFPIIRKEH